MSIRSALLFLVCVSAAALIVAKPTEEETRFLFTKWIAQHQKSYADLQEFNQRFSIFSDNLDFILRHNEEASAGKHSYTLGLTPFADLTNAEYRTMLKTHPRPQKHCSGTHKPTPVKDLPDSVDWRTKGVVTGVKNQGQCGSCWSFSATGSMEGAHALATGNLVALSEQQLVDCVNGGKDNCQVGGYMQDGFQYVISNGGIESEADYPYCACSHLKCKFDPSKVAATFSSYQNVTVDDEDALQSASASRPGVSVAIDASSMAFQLYSSGVFNYPLCGNKFDDLDHGVLVVGYGTDNGNDYWLVKNSWGPDWGLQGYIQMSRNKNNQCGIATDASYVLV